MIDANPARAVRQLLVNASPAWRWRHFTFTLCLLPIPVRSGFVSL